MVFNSITVPKTGQIRQNKLGPEKLQGDLSTSLKRTLQHEKLFVSCSGSWVAAALVFPQKTSIFFEVLVLIPTWTTVFVTLRVPCVGE